MADTSVDAANVDLGMDLCDLIKRGYPNEAIIRELELRDTPDQHKLLDYMRASKDQRSAT